MAAPFLRQSNKVELNNSYDEVATYLVVALAASPPLPMYVSDISPPSYLASLSAVVSADDLIGWSFCAVGNRLQHL